MDFKQTKIDASALPVDDLAGGANAAVTEALVLSTGRGALRLLPNSAGQVVLPQGVELDDIRAVGRDLVVTMPDGTEMIIPDGAVFIPQIVIQGVAIPPLNLAALLTGQEPQPAAGLLQSSGGNFADPIGRIGDPFDLGDLLPPTQLDFGQPEEREIIPNVVDRDDEVTIVTPDQPAGSTNATSSVSEAALPQRGSEPAGSNEASNAENTSGSIIFSVPDGLQSITLNGTPITTVGQVFTTPLGVLTITSIATGNIGYSYTLTDNTLSPASNEVFTVVVTDRDGDVATANLTINIIDDAPTARDDTDLLPAGTYGPQIGNVIDGSGTTSGAAGADTLGADGALVSGIRVGSEGGFSGIGAIQGLYGSLNIAANGSYTYVRNPGTPGGVNDVFSYRLTDGDGDVSTANLTINIGDSPPVITFVPQTGDGTIVSEAGLPARGTKPPGSQAELPIATTSGTITFNAPDGPATVQVNGILITGPGQIITTPAGIFTVTAVGPNSIGYNFTLTDNVSGPNVKETLSITVTDVDGDSVTEPLVISIVDDVPTAVDDNDAVAAGSYDPATGNVITDAEGDGGKDTSGADGVTVTGIVAGATVGMVGSALQGMYGKLTIGADGTYSYVRDPGTKGGVTDIFRYMITDGDGSTSSANLSISIADSGTMVAVPQIEEPGTLVFESGLPARAGESAGSDADANTETTNGTINFAAPDGPAIVSIAGIIVTGAGQIINGAYGTLAINTLTQNSLTYSYTLADNVIGDGVSETFNVVVTDQDGDSSSAPLIINIVNDAPIAADDMVSLTEGGPSSVTFNVDSNDVPGADSTGSRVFDSLEGIYGNLSINLDGTQTYTLNATGQAAIDALAPGATLSDTFNYILTDGDGDSNPAKLVVTLNGTDDPVFISNLTPALEGGDASVDEDDLPNGSDTAKESLTTTGDFSVAAPDGLGSLTVGGLGVIVNGVYQGGSLTTPFGNTLTFTGFNAATGVVSYSYTLNGTQVHANASGENNAFENLTVTLTDLDGSNASDTLSIKIIDDVPMAKDDLATASEDMPVKIDALANDIKGADGVNLTTGVSLSTLPTLGNVVYNNDGTFTYTPTVGKVGQDSFTYTIIDADGDQSAATVTITLAPDSTPVIKMASNLTVDEDGFANANADNVPLQSAPAETASTGSATDLTGTAIVNFGNDVPANLLGSIALINPAALNGQLANLNGVAVTFALEGGTGDLVGSASGSEVIRIHITNAVTGPNAGDVTYSYSATLSQPLMHADDESENSALLSGVQFQVTDSDGSPATGSFSVTIFDDVPTANADAAITVDEDAMGTVGGNLLANDQLGADGATVTAVTINGNITDIAQSGTTTISTAFGTYIFAATGVWTFDPNSNLNNASGVDASFVYHITDADGDKATASQTITVVDGAGPTVGAAISLQLDDSNLAAGSTSGNPDFATGSIVFTPGSDAIASIVFSTDLSSLGGGLSWTRTSDTQVVGKAGATTIVTLSLSVTGNTASVTATLNSNYASHPVVDVDDLAALGSVAVVATDIDGDPVSGTVSVSVSDDLPTITATAPANSALTVDESNFSVNATANFAGLFTPHFNADGASTTHLPVYALAIGDGPTGIKDTATGQDVVLVLNGTVVEGRTAGSNALVFTVSVNAATGDVTLGQIRAVIHGDTNSVNEAISLASSGLITLSETITDADGDTAKASIGIGNAITFLDDGPRVSNDVDSVTEDGPLIADGNVITGIGGSDANATDGAIDLPGADGGSITAISFGGAPGIVGVALNGAYGSFKILASGLYEYTLNNANPLVQALSATQTLKEIFTYVLTDGDGDSLPATLTITINGTNDAPVINADTNWVLDVVAGADPIASGNVLQSLAHNGAPDAAVRGDVADTDVDGDTLTVTTTGVFVGTYGTLTLGANGSYSYVLNSNNAAVNALDDGETVADSFNYSATDGTATVPSTLTITIFGTNDAPVAKADTNWVLEDGAAASGNVLQTLAHNGAPDAAVRGDVADTDVDIEPLTVSNPGVINGTYGQLTLNANGSYSYTLFTQAQNPAAYDLVQARNVGDPPLSDVFNYTVTDSTATDNATLTISIFGTNDAPVINADTNWVLDVVAGADPIASGNVLQSLAHNGAPDAVVRGDVADTDVDGDALTVTTIGVFAGTYGTLTLAANGVYSYTLNSNNAVINALDDGETVVETFAYSATDGTVSVPSTLKITIFGTNDAPVAKADTNWVLEDGAAASGNVLQTLAHNGAPDAAVRGDVADTDVDIEPLTVSNPGVINGTYGQLTLNANGSYSYTLFTQAQNPAAYDLVQARNVGDPPLSDVFNYTVTDSTATDNATLTISIFGTNDAPVVGNAMAIVSEEGLTPNGIPDTNGTSDTTDAASITGNISITDVDNTAFTVTLGNPGAVLTSGGVAVTWTGIGTGTLTGSAGVTPVISITINNTGAYTVTLLSHVDHADTSVEDVLNFSVPVNVSDGTVSVPSTLTVTIEDDSPIAHDDSVTTIEGAATLNGNVLTNDQSGADTPAVVSAISGGALSVPIVTSFGTLTVFANGNYIYSPKASVPNGSVDSFTYTMKDADGDSSTATLKFTFSGDANVPTASSVSASVDDDALAGNPGGVGDLPDANADGDNNQATFSGNLGFGYGPDGAGSFAFNNGPVTIGQETVNIVWNSGTSTATGVISGGARNGMALFTVAVNTTTGAYTLTLLKNVIHTSGGDENDALASLAYTVTDSDNSTAPGALNILFDDDTPIARADQDSVVEGGTETGNVLTGVGTTAGAASADSPGADGYEGQGVVGVRAAGSDTVNAVTTGAGSMIAGLYGTLVLGPNGGYTYKANPNAVITAASDVFVYSIRDGDGDIATTTLTINVSNVTVLASSPDGLVNEAGLPNGSNAPSNSEIYNGSITASGGVGSYTYTLNGSSNGSYGNLVLNANGTYTYTLTSPYDTNPDANNGTNTEQDRDSFSYTVTDANGNSTTGTILIDIIDDVPVLTAVSDLSILNAIATYNGTINFDYGADDLGTITLHPLTAIPGIVYTGDNSGNVTATVNGIPYFNISVNQVTGDYTVNVLSTRPVVDTPLNFANIASGNYTTVTLPGGQVFDGVSYANGTTTARQFTNDGSTINPSGNGFGIANNLVNDNEGFLFSNPKTAALTFDVNFQPNTSQVTITYATYNGTAPVGNAAPLQTGTLVVNTDADGIVTVVIDPTLDFDHIVVRFDYTGSGNPAARVQNFSVSQQVIPDDQVLKFEVKVTDADGDVVTGMTAATTIDLTFQGGAPVPPVALDLDGNGVQFQSLAAGVTFNYAGDGNHQNTAWVGSGDGLLAYDRNGDGLVNNGSEIVFGGGGRTDLEGLAAQYDSNHDGQLSAADIEFDKFGVWQDANSNGVSEPGEFQTLTAVGIVSIGLVSDGNSYSAANGQVVVSGQAIFTRADGTTGIVADAAFAVGSAAIANRTLEQNRDTGFNTAIIAASLVAAAAISPLAMAQDADFNVTTNVAPSEVAVLPEAANGEPHYSDNIANGEYFGGEIGQLPQPQVEASFARSSNEMATEHSSILNETGGVSDLPAQLDTQAGDTVSDGFVPQPVMGLDAGMESLLALADVAVSANSANIPIEQTGISALFQDIMLESTIDQLISDISQIHTLSDLASQNTPLDSQSLQILLDQVISPATADTLMASTGFDFQMHDMAAQHG